MSVMFETRPSFLDGSYPAMDDVNDHSSMVSPDDVARLDEPDITSLAAAAASYTAGSHSVLSDGDSRLDLAPAIASHDEDLPTVAAATAADAAAAVAAAGVNGTPSRTKSIPKPERDVERNVHGRYECVWQDCTEEVRDFSRKCEWNKHMDKHERPYRCMADGCQKLPGFTYGGGLLRHEREVHGKHGGPKKSLNCPHAACKRHTGKGFSRLENLNEHLRRVHTDEGMLLSSASAGGGDVSDDALSETTTPGGGHQHHHGHGSHKRKRESISGGMVDDDIREEFKRVKIENEELRRQVEAQNAQTVNMMQQIKTLQQALGLKRQLGPDVVAVPSLTAPEV